MINFDYFDKKQISDGEKKIVKKYFSIPIK